MTFALPLLMWVPGVYCFYSDFIIAICRNIKIVLQKFDYESCWKHASGEISNLPKKLP